MNKKSKFKIGDIVKKRYQIVEYLDTIRYKNIFRVRDLELDILVIMEEGIEKKYNDDLLNEARILMKFTQEHIVKCLNFFEENGSAFIIIEDVRYYKLSDLLKNECKLSFDRVEKLALQLMDVLEFIHNQGYVYLNVSPEEILINQLDEIKLFDFSFLNKSSSKVNRLFLMEDDKNYYLPLEYEDNTFVKEDSDIYGLGALLYELISGKKPYPAKRRKMITEKYYKEILEKLTNIEDSVPEHVDQAIQCSLSLKRNKRFHNISEFRRALLNEVELKQNTKNVNIHKKRAFFLVVINCIVIVSVVLMMCFHERSRFNSSSFKECDLSVLLYYEVENEKQLNEQIVNAFNKEYPKFNVKMHQVKKENYYEEYLKYKPDVFYYDELISENNLANMSEFIDVIDKDLFYGFSQLDIKNKLPLSFETALYFVNQYQKQEDSNKQENKLTNFINKETATYVGSSTQLEEISKSIPGYWDIEEKEKTAITYHDFICAKKGEDYKERASFIFINEMLSDLAQNNLYIQAKRGYLPVNIDTLKQYIEGYPELQFLLDTTLVMD